jgi:hypothetical protein
MKSNTNNSKQRLIINADMNNNQLSKALRSSMEDGTIVSMIERAALEMHDAGQVVEAEETFVKCAGERVKATCSHFFNLDEVQYRDLPKIAREIAKLLVKNGRPSEWAKEYAQNLTGAAGSFIQMEKRVFARERLMLDAGSKQLIKLGKRAARERRKMSA